jgi:hypothetical protein
MNISNLTNSKCTKNPVLFIKEKNWVYLQEGRFSTTVGSKKHPELPRRNPKRAVPKNRHDFSLLCCDREIHILTLDGDVLGSISPVKTESKRITTKKGRRNCKF